MTLEQKFNQEDLSSACLALYFIFHTIVHSLLSHTLIHNFFAVIVWDCQLRYQLFSLAGHIYPVAQPHIAYIVSCSLLYF